MTTASRASAHASSSRLARRGCSLPAPGDLAPLDFCGHCRADPVVAAQFVADADHRRMLPLPPTGS